MCSNISNFQNPTAASTFTMQVQETLKPIYEFIDNWFDKYLNSTWPETEMSLIQNIMKEKSKGAEFPEDADTYDALIETISTKMNGIGHIK